MIMASVSLLPYPPQCALIIQAQSSTLAAVVRDINPHVNVKEPGFIATVIYIPLVTSGAVITL